METTEETIQRTGATKGPRVTPADLEAVVMHEYYFTALNGISWSTLSPTQDMGEPIDHQIAQSLKMLTMCVLVLRNGFTVVGHAGVASPENYNEEVGKKVARGKALEQLWPILGYQLKNAVWVAAQLNQAEIDAQNSRASTDGMPG